MAKGETVENRYTALIERIFVNHFKPGSTRLCSISAMKMGDLPWSIC